MYKARVCECIIAAGVWSLQTEPGGAPFLTCEYVSDAALSLGHYDIVRWCAEILRNWNQTLCAQIKNFKRKIKTSAKNRWLQQIANDEAPDFNDY